MIFTCCKMATHVKYVRCTNLFTHQRKIIIYVMITSLYMFYHMCYLKHIKSVSNNSLINLLTLAFNFKKSILGADVVKLLSSVNPHRAVISVVVRMNIMLHARILLSRRVVSMPSSVSVLSRLESALKCMSVNV